MKTIAHLTRGETTCSDYGPIRLYLTRAIALAGITLLGALASPVRGDVVDSTVAHDDWKMDDASMMPERELTALFEPVTGFQDMNLLKDAADGVTIGSLKVEGAPDVPNGRYAMRVFIDPEDWRRACVCLIDARGRTFSQPLLVLAASPGEPVSLRTGTYSKTLTFTLSTTNP